ncbi:MAG: gamma-glutamylcyclotransferase [Sandaracinus sp.]|nr:gamma-glutamylcyclotransferase [Sandaracinus sp.]
MKLVADPKGEAFVLDHGGLGEVLRGRCEASDEPASAWAFDGALRRVSAPDAPGQTLPLFVYGSLRRGRSAEGLLTRFGPTWGAEGHVGGTLLDLGAYPAWLARGEGCVHGELVSLPDPATAFVVLDEYEDFAGWARDPRPSSLYLRLPVRVTCAREEVWAWAYAWNGDPEQPVVASGRWER